MDDRKRILILAVIGAAILALLGIILPDNLAHLYISIMQPLTLFVGFILALQVSLSYARELKKSFIFLSLFLLLYVPINIQILVQYMIGLMGSSLIYVVLALQIVDYAMLLASCFYTVKVIDVKRMNRYGWTFLALLVPLCVYIIYRSFQVTISNFTGISAIEITDILIRVIDMMVILMLVPVLFLYLQYLKAKAQESVTFTFIMGGLILSLLSTYLFEFIYTTGNLEDNPFLNAAYLFGYLLMAIGLYANRKYDEWGFKMIEKALR